MYKNMLSKFILIVFVSLITISGCDVDFGGTGSDGGDDDAEVSSTEEIAGTISDVSPNRDSGVENIDVTITNDNNVAFSTSTDSSGNFSIDANLDGSPEIEFTDPEDGDESLGKAILNVFPGVIMDLGDINLDDDGITFEDDTEVNFVGDLTEIDCTDDSGTIDVEIDGDDEDVEVLVQINSSTDIELDNGDDADCNDFFIGQDLEIDGELLVGDSVDADEITIDD